MKTINEFERTENGELLIPMNEEFSTIIGRTSDFSAFEIRTEKIVQVRRNGINLVELIEMSEPFWLTKEEIIDNINNNNCKYMVSNEKGFQYYEELRVNGEELTSNNREDK